MPLPKALLPTEAANVLRPRYLREHDHPWLRALLDVYAGHAGRPRRELDDRLREPIVPEGAPDKRKRAIYVLDRACRTSVEAAAPPRRVRATLFAQAARGGSRQDALERASRELGLAPSDVERALFADLPSERRLGHLPDGLDPGALALQTNLALVQGLVARSSRVVVSVLGNARDIVRHAQLRGLICDVHALREGARLVISGPLALFRRTLVYGRALSSLVPRLPWCRDFELRAEYLLEGEPVTLHVRPGDPVWPAREPKRFDSELEQRFARDFQRDAPEWDLIREPAPLRAGARLIFVDFGLLHRASGARFSLEIVGFWTEGYLEQKLARLREARIENLILCVDEARACGRVDWPAGARVVPYRRRIDITKVLRATGLLG